MNRSLSARRLAIRAVFRIAFCCVAATCSTTFADVELLVDLDPGTPGIQAEGFYNNGDLVNADLVLNLPNVTATTPLSGYSFTVRFDTSELTFSGRSESPANAGTGWTEFIVGGNNDLPNGLLFNFDGLAPSGSFITPPTGPFVIGNISFTAVNPTGDGTDPDIEIGFFDNVTDGLVDDNDTLIPGSQITLGFASVSAVPEPTGAAGTILAMIAGCVFRRRRIG